MGKITDKKFLKFIKELKDDMKYLNQTSFVKDLEHIIKTKTLTVVNSADLILFIHYRKVENPLHYGKEYSILLSLGYSKEEANEFMQELREEHDYIHKVLSKHFTWKKIPNSNYYGITRKKVA